MLVLLTLGILWLCFLMIFLYFPCENKFNSVLVEDFSVLVLGGKVFSDKSEDDGF